nr:hypothetical protein GCM10020185_50320 [Pseudomonas brassicacearum subsp. brassicacearum]
MAKLLAQRHGRPGRHRRAQAQSHGVDTGHGAGLFGEVALDDARQQHADHTDTRAGQDAADKQPDLTEGAAQDNPARQRQQDPQHHALGTEAPRQHRRQRREQAQAKHRQCGQQTGLGSRQAEAS